MRKCELKKNLEKKIISKKQEKNYHLLKKIFSVYEKSPVSLKIFSVYEMSYL